MQSSDSQTCSDQRQSRPRLAGPGAKSIPPGALAGYFQAQQCWRKTQAGARQSEASSHQYSQSSYLSGSASANSTSSCSTSDRHLEAYGTCQLPALGCRSVAKLFEKRHELMVRHRHQRQAAKRRKVSSIVSEAPPGLLSLPEDVLVRAVSSFTVLLGIAFVCSRPQQLLLSGLQLHIVYNLEHEDIQPLFQVCQELRSMVIRGKSFPCHGCCGSSSSSSSIFKRFPFHAVFIDAFVDCRCTQPCCCTLHTSHLIVSLVIHMLASQSRSMQQQEHMYSRHLAAQIGKHSVACLIDSSLCRSVGTCLCRTDS